MYTSTFLHIQTQQTQQTQHPPTQPKREQRAQYSRDVVDGKVNPNPDTPIMTKRELKRVVAANKAVKEKGFRAD